MAGQVSDLEFVELLTSAQVRLLAYAMSMVRTSADAEDIVQNACVALWEKRAKYDPERDFLPWACGTVLIEVLRYRRKVATDKLLFDEVLLNTLATDFVQLCDKLDRRRELLHYCVEKLRNKERSLLTDRYRRNIKPKELASKLGRPATTVYSALARIRENLYRCVEARLAQDAHMKP